MNSIRNQVLSVFKLNGFTLKAEATKYVVDLLTPIEDDERSEWLDKLVDMIQKQGLPTAAVEKSHIEAAAKECCRDDSDDTGLLFNLIPAFSFPRFSYVSERKKLVPAEASKTGKSSFFGGAGDKAEIFRHRYSLLFQRTSRHALFTPSVTGTVSSNSGSQKYQLRPMEYLLGTTGKLSGLVVLGMLTQLKEGQLFIEDPTGFVPIEIGKDTVFHEGIFTETCFVLCQGTYEDGIFKIEHMGMPPPEPSRITRAYFGNANFFGGPSPTSVKSSIKLKEREEQNPDAMMVFLSDVWLDQIRVLEKLRVLFAGYSDLPPLCFVFLGNFSSSSQGTVGAELLRKNFKALADVICDFPSLVRESRFIFVPGPADPGFANILPRPAFPGTIVGDFVSRVPSAEFTTNPCRVQYATQEIVILREDIVTKMCRNAIHLPESRDIPTHVARTLTAQGHLCPLTSEICPVYWSWDHTLSLYPLPDVIVIADRFDSFTATHLDCTIFNPGPFSRNSFNFKVYLPHGNRVEDSEIGND